MGREQAIRRAQDQTRVVANAGLPVDRGRAPRPRSTGKDQYATEAEAKASCPADTVVWVNPRSKVYHASGSRNYGKTKRGAYMCEKDRRRRLPCAEDRGASDLIFARA